MSAFIVSNKHISTIISYAMQEKIYLTTPNGDPAGVPVTDDATAQMFGHLLMAENVASVAHRYASITPEEKGAADAYRFQRVPGKIAHDAAVMACACLDYQSCEHDGWRSSAARRVLLEIQAHAAYYLVTEPRRTELPWHIDD